MDNKDVTFHKKIKWVVLTEAFFTLLYLLICR